MRQNRKLDYYVGELEIEIGRHPGAASSEHSAGSYLNLGNL